MSDKKKSEPNKPSDDKAATASSSAADTENQQGLSASINLSSSSTDEKPKSQDKKATDTSTEQKPVTKTTRDMSKAPVNKTSPATPAKARATNTTDQKNKLSKTAVVALLIALLAIAASAGHYYWNEQQKAQFSQQLSNEFQKQLQLSQAQVSQQLLQQKQQNNAQLKTIETSVQRNTASNIEPLQQQLAQLEQQIVSLGQSQPSDWLLHEAEYLIRVASRSLWLEKDTTAAIGLLHDAERRIQELNDPQFLSLRQIIQQDIAGLQLLPKLNTDEVILKLMALAHQSKQLPLAMVNIPTSSEQESDLELTENASDWRENLAKSWDKFTNDFITVSRRTGNVEPLMSPTFQQNLRENLNLKLQTAIWAASKGSTEIYRQSLSDINAWLQDYFDMTDTSNQRFSEALSTLKNETVNVSYPNKLASLALIRDILSSNKTPIVPEPQSEAEPAVLEPAAAKPDEETKTEQREDA
jgi:uroporphyrin-3 C-methyltransferase